MFGKSYRILAVSVLLLSLSLLWARPVSRGAVPLWYEFHVGQEAGEAASHVAVTLPNHTGCAGAFQVFADGSWGFWDTPSEEDWIGTGSDAGYGMTMWASDLVPGTYYVRMGTGANPACGLGVSGVAVDRVEVIDLVPGVEEIVMTSEAAAPESAATQWTNVPTLAADADFLWVEADKVAVAHNPGPAPQSAAKMTVAHNPGPALQPAAEMAMVPGEWMPIMDNEPHLFTFYVGDVDGDDTSHVGVTLYSGPWKGGQFQVFAAGTAPFGKVDAEDWMGHSYQIDGEDPAWYGDLVPGAYEVLVEAQGAKECLLAISGAAVRY